jgi:hypothetical protein
MLVKNSSIAKMDVQTTQTPNHEREMVEVRERENDASVVASWHTLVTHPPLRGFAAHTITRAHPCHACIGRTLGQKSTVL